MSRLPFEVWEPILDHLSLESLELLCCHGLNKAFNGFLFEWRVKALCSVLAVKGVDEVARRLKSHNPLGISADLGRLDQVRRFAERHRDAKVKSVWEWMQLASQEPDEGWLCKGVSDAMLERAGKYVMRQVVGKPQEFGMLLDTIKGHSRAVGTHVRCVAWNQDRSLLASCFDHNWSMSIPVPTIKLLDPRTMEEKGTLRGHSRDNPECTCHHVEWYGMWDVNVNANCPVTGHSNIVWCVEWNHDGSLLASGSHDHTVRLWTPDGQEKGTLRGHTMDNPECKCKFLHGRVTESDPECPVRGHSGPVYCVAFSPDSKTLASGSGDETVKLWDLSSGTLTKKGTLKGHSNSVLSVAFSPDSKILASASADKTVKLWDLSGDAPVEKGTLSGAQKRKGLFQRIEEWLKGVDPRLVGTLRGHSDCVRCVAFSPDGAILTSASDDRTVKLWDPTTMEEKGKLGGHSSGNPECTCQHSVNKERGVEEYQVDPECPVRGHTAGVNSVAFSPDSKFIASGSGVCSLLPSGARGVNDSWMIARGRGSVNRPDCSVRIWDVSTGEVKGTLRGHTKDNPECTCWKEEGSESDSDDDVFEFTYRSFYKFDPECPVTGHWHSVSCVAWNHDGSLIFSAAFDGTVKLWDPRTMEEKGSMSGDGAGHVNSWQGLDPETTDLAAMVQEGGRRNVSISSHFTVKAVKKKVLVYKTVSDGEEQGEPIACFCCKKRVSAVFCKGTSVIAGCSDGQVLFLAAPFLDEGPLLAMGQGRR